MAPAKSAARVRRLARQVLGLDDLREGQELAIKSVLDGNDTLAVMPTGFGKSAIYQIAGMMLPGATVVISPLIALQRDQLESLAAQEAGAAMLNSTLHAAERREAFEDLQADKLEFLLLAPEQLSNAEVMANLQESKPSLFVIDEAHCISEWGHDFRPDYLKLGSVIEALSHPPILALTATASPPVREEIIERLGMRDPQVIVYGFDRPNLQLSVERFESELHKEQSLLERVAAADKPGIVYVATRRRAEELAEKISAHGAKAAAYHGGMRGEERERAQDDFMEDRLDVIVATTAFGMGVDKANVRFVFHYDISESIDSYYQEIGRAGRDGNQSLAILFYRPEDLGIRRFFAGAGHVDLEQLQMVAAAICKSKDPVNPTELGAQTGLSQSKLTSAITRLEDLGAVEIQDDGSIKALDGCKEAAIIEEAADQQERHRSFVKSRIEMMRGYAELRGCRREYLLNYFGEEYLPPCDSCDNCLSGRAGEQPRGGDEPFPINSRVAHSEWGEGLVIRYETGTIVVLFDEVGYKMLALDLVVEQQLIRPVTE